GDLADVGALPPHPRDIYAKMKFRGLLPTVETGRFTEIATQPECEFVLSRRGKFEPDVAAFAEVTTLRFGLFP
ncbi:MAG: hypothetical protein KUG62_03785, partial [Rhodobacteraceae bacterium]|nr:hypothetical protein [Paracoccaceae bacterium]